MKLVAMLGAAIGVCAILVLALVSQEGSVSGGDLPLDRSGQVWTNPPSDDEDLAGEEALGFPEATLPTVLGIAGSSLEGESAMSCGSDASPQFTSATPAQLSLISAHEIAPGLRRDNAIQLLATRSFVWDDEPSVDRENIGARGYAFLLMPDECTLTSQMLIASWGEPDSIGETEINGFPVYVYLEPPYGEIHVVIAANDVPMSVTTYMTSLFFQERNPAWTPGQCEMVARRSFALGFNEELVLASWGEPLRKNRSVGAWGTSEQWVYPQGVYLYFENGILESWRDSR